MSRLSLIKPSEKYAEQVMGYKNEMFNNGDSFDGCAGLEDAASFSQWIDFEKRLKAKGNIISNKTILNNSGILENEVIDSVGLSKTGIIQRYWIKL